MNINEEYPLTDPQLSIASKEHMQSVLHGVEEDPIKRRLARVVETHKKYLAWADEEDRAAADECVKDLMLQCIYALFDLADAESSIQNGK